MSDKIEITIHTARPGLVIGKKGSEIDVLRGGLSKMTGKEVWIEVEEIKRPDLDAKIVADGIAKQLERRIPFRRAMKKAMQSVLEAGGAGVRVQCSGRLGGAEIARREWYKEGIIPLQTMRADIDFAYGRAETTYGSIGVKVWINRGETNLIPKRAKLEPAVASSCSLKDSRSEVMTLMPKKTKHRKMQKGQLTGFSKAATFVDFGDFGMQVLERGWITSATNRSVPCCYKPIF